MRCNICGKDKDRILRAIKDDRVLNICEVCASMEDVILVKGPTKEQLDAADKRPTVRQTMEKLSGYYKRPIANVDHDIPDRNIDKIKVVPTLREASEELVPNYYWEIKIGRRRKKMTINDLSKATGISLEILERIERGFLPKNYIEVIEKIEDALHVKLLKEREEKIKFNFPQKQEKIDIEKLREEKLKKIEGRDAPIIEEKQERKIEFAPLDKTRSRMALDRLHRTDSGNVFERKRREQQEREESLRRERLERDKRKEEVKQQIEKEQFDFSRKDKIKDLTLSDLIDIKRKKDKEALVGKDVEIEED